jgi:hypothetical protein
LAIRGREARRAENFLENRNVADQYYQHDCDKHENHGADDDQRRGHHLFLGRQGRRFFLFARFHGDILALSRAAFFYAMRSFDYAVDFSSSFTR